MWMICLFCKATGAVSRSEEHVLPVSLGNSRLVLPPGVVCDACNSYFSVKVEKPLVEAGRLRDLRARQDLRSRRGRPLARRALLSGSGLSASFLVADDQIVFWADRQADQDRFWTQIDSDPTATLLPIERSDLDPLRMSRLLAKGALEHLALKTHNVEGWETYAWNPEFDALRQWARGGVAGVWPFHERRLYDEHTPFVRADGDLRQTIWEAELWQIAPGLHYWVVCLFGVEYAINFRDRETRSYRDWLRAYEGLSPLYAHRQPADQGIPRGFSGRAPI